MSLIGLPNYYSAAATFVPVTGATDIFTITGFAGRVIKIGSLGLTLTQPQGAPVVASIVKRSTANTGGVSSLVNKVPYNSISPAAGAVVRSYTANSVVGVSVGVVRQRLVYVSPPALGGVIDPWIYSMAPPEQSILLLSASEVLAINLNGAALTSATAYAWITWYEEF